MKRVSQEALYGLVRMGGKPLHLDADLVLYDANDIAENLGLAAKEGRTPQSLDGYYLTKTTRDGMLVLPDAILYFCVSRDNCVNLSVTNVGGVKSTIILRVVATGDVEIDVVNIIRPVAGYASFLLRKTMMMYDPDDDVKHINNMAATLHWLSTVA